MDKKYSLSQLASIYCVYKDLSLSHTVSCCTCGKVIDIYTIEDCYKFWGHFLPRSTHRKLIYHPNNSHAQCVDCNVFTYDIKAVEEKYENYMHYRYGNSIVDALKFGTVDEKFINEDYLKEFYISELLKLSTTFPELVDIVINKTTGEIIENINIITNSIEEQFFTFSQTYKSDLDILCKAIGSKNYVEYQRF